MAGIGFELRKIFGKKTLLSNTYGILYASMVSVGPSLVFILLLFAIRFLMQHYFVTELENLFFTSSFTYAFFVAIIVSAFFNTIVSRYISDQVFEGKESDICASMFGTLTIGSVISGVVALLLCGGMYFRDHVPVQFLVAYYLLIVLASNVYNMITYVSAIKEYVKVAVSYLSGVGITLILFFVFYHVFHMHLILAVYWALVAGFFVINLLLVAICVKMFGIPSNHYFSFLRYYKKYPQLLLSGCAYMWGFYVSNLVYWQFSDMSVQISIFKTAPNYDMAIFMAMLINLSGMVIFEVKTETTFYEKYVEYLSAVNKGTYDLLESRRESLQNTISLQLFFLFEVQLIITIILICLINVFYPYLGLGSQILNLFLLLGMGLFCVFCMYSTVIFLYYFEDYHAAAISTGVFLAIVLVGAFICCIIGEPYYPIPVLAGGVVGWIVSFILLRKRLKNLNTYLLCK